MKIWAVLFGLLILTSCKNHKNNGLEFEENYSFFVGTYTNEESKGIYKYNMEEDGSLHLSGLVAETNNPSFLCISTDKKFLLANTEISNKSEVGNVESYLISKDSLIFISRSSSGGAHPCFVSINEEGYVLTANYTSGNVGLLKINSEGKLSDILDVKQHTGKGITDRQDAPHAHSAWFNPANNGVIAVDLGTNDLWFYSLDTVLHKLQTSDPSKIPMAEGAGPRHLVFHPNNKWIYVINELNSTVSLVNMSVSDKEEVGKAVSTLPSDFTDANFCADIHVSSDGEFVYASNRGHNSIAILKVNQQNGSLTLLGTESTHGNWPRNFSLSPDNNYLLVANQKSNNLVSFKRDKATGLLEYVDDIEAVNPSCVIFN